MKLFIAMLMCVQSVRATVLFQAPGTSGLDYRAALKADSDAKTPSQAYMNTHPTAENRTRLLNLFAEAQQSFLTKPGPEAKAGFSNLLSLLPEDDWNREAREVFLHAYFRLAQMEVDTVLQTKLLTQALLLGDDLSVPADLFPPPLVRKFVQLKSELPRQHISPSFFQDGWNAILINGAVCTKQNCMSLPALPLDARVTFVSDQWMPFTASMNVNDLNSFNPKRVPWISGDCSHTVYSEPAMQHGDRKSFWTLNCTQLSTQNIGKKPELRFQPTDPLSSNGSLPPLQIHAEKSPIYKSGWFWAGVGAVAVAALVASAKKSTEKEPTTTYGY